MLDKAIPAGLKLWLAFLASFILLGYPVVPSIFFGLIGAIAGGMIAAWWQTLGGIPVIPDAPKKTKDTPGALQRLGARLRSRTARLPLPRFRPPRLKDQASRSRR